MTTQPDIQRKLRNSILESIPELQDRPPTYEDLTPTNLPYLEAVVQETLRVSRTAGGVSRTGQFNSDVLMGKGEED
jgi:cytochrome P450